MLHQIGARSVRDYHIGRTGITVGTYLKEFRVLKAMLNRAVEWEHLKENPIKHVKPPKDVNSRPPHYYTAEQLQALYKVSDKRYQWQFVANTGLRLSEALQLDLSKDISNGKVYVLSSESARSKSGKWREIPLFKGASDALGYIDDNRLFRILDKSVSRAFRKDCAAAGLDGSFHSLRHTFASHLAMSGKFSLIEIKELMGHSSIVTTQRYQHLIPNYREIDMEAINL